MRFKFLFAILLLPTLSYSHSSHLLIGGNYNYAQFETDGLDSSKGQLGGAQALYEYKKSNSIYQGLRFTVRWGELRQSGGTRNLRDIDGRGSIGYTFRYNNFFFTPFTGFGWRYIRHNLKQSGYSSLKFYYNEPYIPLGMNLDYYINSYFSIGLKATWMPQVFSAVKIQPIGNVYWELEKNVKNGQLEVPLTFYFPKKCVVWTLQLNPYFQYWKDGKTRAHTARGIALDLPSNTYKLWGGEVNLGCSF